MKERRGLLKDVRGRGTQQRGEFGPLSTDMALRCDVRAMEQGERWL